MKYMHDVSNLENTERTEGLVVLYKTQDTLHTHVYYSYVVVWFMSSSVNYIRARQSAVLINHWLSCVGLIPDIELGLLITSPTSNKAT